MIRERHYHTTRRIKKAFYTYFDLIFIIYKHLHNERSLNRKTWDAEWKFTNVDEQHQYFYTDSYTSGQRWQVLFKNNLLLLFKVMSGTLNGLVGISELNIYTKN